MKRFFGLMAPLLFCTLAAADLGYEVDDRGGVRISSGETVLFDSDSLRLLDGRGTVVADPLKTRMVKTRRGGVTVCSWATDIGVVSRSVAEVSGSVVIEWRVKLLNGITEGRSVELSLTAGRGGFDYPAGADFRTAGAGNTLELKSKAGELKIAINGTPRPVWSFEKAPGEPDGNYRLLLRQPYFPDKVNDITAKLTVGMP